MEIIILYVLYHILVVYQFEILAIHFSVSLELVEDGLVKYSPGFDNLNLTTFQTDTPPIFLLHLI